MIRTSARPVPTAFANSTGPPRLRPIVADCFAEVVLWIAILLIMDGVYACSIARLN
jgi:hypothetical protein